MPFRAATTTLLTAALAVVAVATPATAAPPVTPYIAELHYDNAGTDANEFVEIHVPAGAATAGWSVVLYNGSGGASYDTDAVPAVSAPAGGPDQVAVVSYPANGIQNGSPDGIALVAPGGAVEEFVSYEGVFAATNGPAAGTTSTDIGVAESGSGGPDESLSRRYSPAQDALVWQPPGPNTRGTANPPLDDEPEVPCEAEPTHEIGAVQGTGATTPLAGQQVTVRGVVVGDLPGLSGFHLQDADGDGDASTSDGIFVFSPVPVDRGDDVQVTGGASEFFGQTQISSSQDVEVCGDGTLPAATPLDLPAGDADREPLEGMLVAPADTLVVSEVFNLTRFGELMLAEGGVLVQPTELARPGPEAAAIAAENARRRIVLDDGRSASTSVTNRPYLSPTTPVRVGDELTFTQPVVLGFGFSQWRLQPADGTPEDTFAPQNTRPATPENPGGDVTIASFNVLNYFLTREDPPGRGARTDAEFEEQADKIVPAILALGADVVSLQEIEDTATTGYGDGSPDQAVAELVARLNAAAPEGEVWAYAPFPEELLAVARDAIRNAIIYRADVVEPVGPSVGLVDEDVWFNAREPIAQTFVKDGDVFTVVANHFKSKTPGEPTGDNVDTGDGQGEWNGDRRRQAASLAAFTGQLRSSSGDDDVLIMGDLNAYTEEDPVQDLEDAGFTDLGSQFDAGRYSFVFDALSGSLDHAMASPTLLAKVTDATHWNINAVESFAYQYAGDPALYAPDHYRSSDHDPLLVGLDLDERCFGQRPTIRGTEGDDTLRGTNGADVILALGGNDVVDGRNGDDLVCGGAGADSLAGGNGEDRLDGGLGDDRLDGGNGHDVLIGGPGDDEVVPSRGHDSTS